MSVTSTIGTTVDEVLALVDELDELRFGLVDLRTHALRCARLALTADADDALVVAALLHDIGRVRYLAKAAPGVAHEEVGRRFVEDRFGARAGWLVAQHVVAKRCIFDAREHSAGAHTLTRLGIRADHATRDFGAQACFTRRYECAGEQRSTHDRVGDCHEHILGADLLRDGRVVGGRGVLAATRGDCGEHDQRCDCLHRRRNAPCTSTHGVKPPLGAPGWVKPPAAPAAWD